MPNCARISIRGIARLAAHNTTNYITHSASARKSHSELRRGGQGHDRAAKRQAVLGNHCWRGRSGGVPARTPARQFGCDDRRHRRQPRGGPCPPCRGLGLRGCRLPFEAVTEMAGHPDKCPCFECLVEAAATAHIAAGRPDAWFIRGRWHKSSRASSPIILRRMSGIAGRASSAISSSPALTCRPAAILRTATAEIVPFLQQPD
jgi:hypothetical protein